MALSLTSIYSLRPAQTALVAETSLTFGEIRQEAAAIGRGLRAAGLQTGDLVAVATGHRADFYRCFAACFASGFPVAILDPSAATQELALMLRKAAPAALMADESILRRLSDYTDTALPGIVWRVGHQETTGTPTGWLSAWRRHVSSSSDRPSLEELATGEEEPFTVSGDGELTAYVMFTSGTTSTPKAVVVSRAALCYHVGTLSTVFGYCDDARLLCYLPTHHTDGLVHGVVASLLTGMTVVHPGAFGPSVDLEQVLRANNISHFLTVPTMLAMIKRSFGDRPGLFQYEGFRGLISTAGYLDEQLWKDVQDSFRVRVSNFYGMTETVSGSLYCGPDDSSYRFGTLGKPVDTDVRIVGDDGDEVHADTIGELQISGEHLMTGYLDDPEATKAAIADGWLSTGDLFTRDEDGFFHFAGRRKNIIKRGGLTVYPEDIRSIVSVMPGVREVEVVGLPDSIFEEIIAVCAVVEAGIGAEDIRAMCRDRLSPERRPDRIELMNSLPRGPSGKVKREALIAMLGERKSGERRSASSVRERIIEVAAETFAVEPSELDESSSPDTVANWDSYALMEFVLALESEFALRLKPRAIMRLCDIGQAIRIISTEVDATEMDR